MARKTDRRTLYTRMVIRDAYCELLKEHEPDRIAVTELCRRAGINRSTFYLHYDDSTSVLEELMEEVIDRIRLSVRAVVEEGSDITVSGRAVFEELISDERTAFLLKKSLAYPPFISRISDAVAEEELAWGIPAEGLGEDDLREVLRALNYSAFSLNARWARKGDPAEIERGNRLVAERLFNPVMEGLFSKRREGGGAGRA